MIQAITYIHTYITGNHSNKFANARRPYAADFTETWPSGHGVYGEHGDESIHKIFRLLQRTYFSMQSATRGL